MVGDQTGRIQKGDKIMITQTTKKYFYVTAVSYSAPNTTITVTGGTDFTLANAAIVNPHFSKFANPQGFPQWFSYTPTYGGSVSMTYTSVTTTHAKFSIQGNVCTISAYFQGTTGGTASNALTFTAPVASINNIAYVGGIVGDGGTTLAGSVLFNSSTTVITCRKYDVSNFGLGGSRYAIVSGSYQI